MTPHMSHRPVQWKVVGTPRARRTWAVAAAALLLAGAGASDAAGRTTVIQAVRLQTGLLGAINSVRASHGLPAVVASPALRFAAGRHSTEMAQRGYFEHESIDGTPFWRRLERYFGSTGERYWSVGENLLWNVRLLPAAQVVRLWLGSPPHRRVLLMPRWRLVGISAVRALRAPGSVFAGRDVTIVTVDFGVRYR
jgi:uncharacterized protein YkwD